MKRTAATASQPNSNVKKGKQKMVGNIFRGQPSYKTFDKALGEEDEPLYRLLNEVDPFYSKQIFDGTVESLKINFPAEKSMGDATQPYSWDNFFSGVPKPKINTTEESKDKASKRLEEIACVQEYIRQFEKRERVNLYAPMKPFVKLYRHWYQRKTASLIQKLPGTKYVTKTALPHVNNSMVFNVNTATVENIKLLERKGRLILVPFESSEQMYRSTYLHLDRYINMAIDKDSTIEEHSSIPKVVAANTFIMPFECLLFLLTTGDYIDLPTNMLLNVKSTNDRFKRVEFKLPFPSRNCGWHTNSAIMEIACKVFASQSGNGKWLNLNVNTKSIEGNNPPKINGIQTKPEPDKLCQFDDYLENAPQHNDESDLERNSATVAWQLKSSDVAEEVFQFYTKLEIPGSLDSKCKKLLGCHLYKLENKTKFGCEIFTKYELLKAWLQMKLLKSNTAHCTRLDLHEFHLVMEEVLHLKDIELHLQKHYRVDMSKVLGNLHKFLQLLIETTNKIPNGTYMLRLNQRNREQLLLCGPSMEQTQHAVSLHSILQQNVSDLCFSKQTDYLPIDEELIGPMHRQHNVAPCTFPDRILDTFSGYQEDDIENERKRILKRGTDRKQRNWRQDDIENKGKRGTERNQIKERVPPRKGKAQ